MSKIKTPKIEELFDAGVHFGHLIKKWHPKMEPYIFTAKKNIHIINLEKTDEKIKVACEFLYETAKNGKQIVFVGTKRQAKEIIEAEAKRCGAKFITDRWLGGTITNFKVIKKNIDKLVDMKQKRDAGDYQKYTKKERLMIDREIEKLEKSVGGIVGLKDVPGALFLIDTKREKTALKEARVAKVSVAALLDTNCDPTLVDYPIPGNDDAIKSIAIIVKTVADAVEQGYKDFDEKKAKKAEEDKKQKEEEELRIIRVTSDDENLALGEEVKRQADLEKIIEEIENDTEVSEASGEEKESSESKEDKKEDKKYEKKKKKDEIEKEIKEKTEEKSTKKSDKQKSKK